ncbi:MAG: cardiolipin synthase, partial [Proteobacteria bacterium]
RDEMGEIAQLDEEVTKAPPGLEALSATAKLARQPAFMDDNHIEVLIDGVNTFNAMLEGIARAKKYVLFQSYIIRADEIGERFADALIKKALEGVSVRVLYDGVGTTLHRKYLKKLRKAGVQICRFNSTKFSTFNIQINFRNHRKLLVIDGSTAFLGGLNVGDDYLGKYPKVGPWRDTHCRIEGPAATTAQLSFVKDWFWAADEMIQLDWHIDPVENGEKALVLHTGPADKGETALLAHIAMVNAAEKRVWIANPYVVPPEGLANALELAVLRGVDVRILVPKKNDNLFVQFASETYAEDLLEIGVKYYRYSKGSSWWISKLC